MAKKTPEEIEEAKARKRKEKNRKNMAAFFTDSACKCLKWAGQLEHGQPNICPKHPGYKHMSAFPPVEMLQVIKMFAKNPAALERIMAYVNRFKQAAEELTLEDVQAVADEVSVREIMDR